MSLHYVPYKKFKAEDPYPNYIPRKEPISHANVFCPVRNLNCQKARIKNSSFQTRKAFLLVAPL
jgi:hypothetical protein